jgi:hypothetical protein
MAVSTSARPVEGSFTVIPSSHGYAWLAAVCVAGCSCHQAPPPVNRPVAAPDVRVSTVVKDGAPHSVVRRQNYRMELGSCAVEVDPYDGGRIVEFSLDGRSVIVPVDESPEAYASSFWPSPQSDWSWPPPVEFDKLPWRVAVTGKTLELTSTTSEKLQLSAQQRLAMLPTGNAVSIEFRIINHGSTPRKVAPWQNTRVRPKGITFYPSSEPTYAQSSLKLVPNDGIAWYAHDPTQVKESLKSYADGHEGWMAQIDRNLMFVKVFPDIGREAQAPNEGEIVIYVHDSGRFVEMEQQGAYQELAPGASLTWPVVFAVGRIAADVEIKAGNPRLVALARQLADGARSGSALSQSLQP